MATYQVTSPSGEEFEIEGPDDADPSAVIQQIMQSEAPKTAPAPTEGELGQMAAEGMSGTEKFLAGAGKSVVDTGRGLKQIGAELGNRVGLVGDDTVARLKAEQDVVSARDAPLLASGAGLGGYIGGTAASVLIPGGAIGKAGSAARALTNPATYKAAALSGAVQGAIRPVGTEDSRALNAAAGAGLGVVGRGVAGVAGRVVAPVKNVLDEAGKKAARVLEDAGVPLDTVQRTGSKFLGKVKQGLSGNPYTAGRQATSYEAQQTAYNRAVLRTIGEEADTASEEVLGAARDRIGGVFNEVAERYSLSIDDTVGGQLKGLAARAKRITGERSNPIVQEVNHLMGLVKDGKLEGPAYQAIKTELDSIAKQPNVGPIAREMRDVLDDALEKAAAGTDDFARLKEARSQYGRLLRIADSTDETGRITPAKLWQQFNTKANRANVKFRKGDQELVKLARAGRRVLTDKTPNSGTAERLTAQLAVPGAVFAGTQLATGDPVEAAKYAGLSFLAPKAVQFLINNPAAANKLSEGAKNELLRKFLIAAQQSAVTRQAPLAAGAALEAKQ